MSDILVSIILPIYNVEKYLHKSLDAIVSQSYKNLEIICVIDGSPDNSIEICKKFASSDSRIKIIEHANCGCAKSRNKAIDIASGDYLCFIDPDDYVNSCYIQKLVEAGEKYNADVVSAETIRVGRYNLKKRMNFSGVKKYENKNDIFKSQVCPPDYNVINKMFRADMVRKNAIKFQENVSWCDDVSFCLEALFYSKCVVTVEDAVYYYVKRTDSIVHSQPTKERQLERFNVQSSAMKFLIENGISVPEKEYVITKRVVSLGFFPLLRVRVDVRANKEIYLLFGVIPIYAKNAK